MSYKVGMVSLGCPKNQVDAELMLHRIASCSDMELCSDENEADAVIINTCGFIESAKAEAINTILEFCESKKQTGRPAAVIATGCLSERYREEMLREIPELDGVVGIGCNDKITEIIRRVAQKQTVSEFGKKTNLCMEGGRLLTTPPYSAYLRIADGCDNRCSYCAIPSIRGPFRSRKMEDVLAEAVSLMQKGVTEITLIAQDTTLYGKDLYGFLALPGLLTEMCKLDGIHWIRLLYCYPDCITDELLSVIAENPKICRYMDIPFQHCSKDILRRMNRRGDKESLLELIGKIRSRVPGITLRTTLIAGFPGETEEQFAELCEFVDEAKFDNLGCFAFCAEEGTPAYSMDGQIDEETKQRRQDIIMQKQCLISAERLKGYVGKTVEALTEYYDGQSGVMVCRGQKDAIEIDGKIFVRCGRDIGEGRYINVKVTGSMDYDLTAVLSDWRDMDDNSQ
ncbi:MAG: 30S ribosomal protein S12 methylthiotransferase RimO [Clostridia bacterium]|nr:30S ribosomal protein S12 methylthiotransferase RimO [Clostridia bacterium]